MSAPQFNALPPFLPLKYLAPATTQPATMPYNKLDRAQGIDVTLSNSPGVIVFNADVIDGDEERSDSVECRDCSALEGSWPLSIKVKIV